ncbi:type II toxin-antitoxin system VapC family toxin [Candidatus Rariloculus sp.]|uniref:type II toxin-antitoxin system VapC family toxin n=1 Tax=Candidatus Rariloculus sp. TaxID=3101265 RepID=UPI003D0AD122
MATNPLNLVDSSGWIEFFTDGPNAGMFADPLSEASRLVVPTVSLYEVFRVVLRRRGEDDALRAAALMSRGREIPLSSALALEAARLAHHRSLAMADGIILAAARLTGATLWTQDVDFEGIPHVRYFPRVPA